MKEHHIHYILDLFSCKPLTLETTPPNTFEESEMVDLIGLLLFHHSYDMFLLLRHHRNASRFAVFAHIPLSGKKQQQKKRGYSEAEIVCHSAS